ncbi:MAG: iron-sulfur cluster assembly scaffold protein [Anaerolineae bacterium]|nr:iron-sulfur cluster assembly scaffold protein [Anaerolineae bacterium]
MGDQGKAADFDHMVADLQRQVIEQERALYSDKVLEEAHNPRNLGCMPEPDACGIVRGWCGDTMEIYLRLNRERIKEITFMTDGCGPSVACGSMLTTMVQGMSLEEASEVRPEDLLAALDGLPEESVHCAELTVNTLRQAIDDWHAGGSKEPFTSTRLSTSGKLRAGSGG